MLSSLELSGFKSFADRTRFDFDPGITGVVGPNGSGKSNVVDALKWILGGQSAKSLRGKSMADVIFNGAKGRKPANSAEATLHFDNRKRVLAIDLDEVRVGRRLLRSGDSEYLVNDEAVRLKDVIQLFMGTGAGSNAYSIIEQGRVDQILHANAVARRKVFDEAAGISRSRADRAESERKLERVEQNLVRLRDIVDEVETRLESVRSRAEKAAKYRELSEELRELWWGLAAHDCREIDRRLAELAAGGDDAGRTEELEQRRAECESRLAEIEEELADVESSHRAQNRALANTRETAAARETTIRHERERLVDLESDVLRLRRQRATLAVREREATLEYERTQGQSLTFEREFDELREEVAEREAEIAEATKAVETTRESVTERRQALTAAFDEGTRLDNEAAALEAEVRGLAQERERLEETVHDLDARIVDCERELAEATTVADMANVDVASARTARDEVRDRRAEVVDQLDEYQRTIANRRETRSASEARKNVLEDLESRREGFGIGVREILDRARSLAEAPWNGVRGTVAELLDVDLEHAAVVEVALGERAQSIVVDDAGPLREHLRRGGSPFSGRVGFVPYDGDAPPVPSVDLLGEPGVTARADHLVRSPDQLPGLGTRILADTWVVQSLDDAYRLLDRVAGERVRFVTPLGEVLDADGTLHVGSVRAESAVVSRRSELRRLRSELARLEKLIDSEQDRAELLGDDLVDVENELEVAEQDVRSAVDELAERRAVVERKRHERDRVQAESEATRKRIAELDDRAADCEANLIGLRERREEWTDRVTNLRAEIDAADRDVERAVDRTRTLERERDERRLDLAKQEERLDGLRASGERLRLDLEQRREQLAESERRNGVVVDKYRDAVLHLLNTRAELDESLLDRDSLADRARGLAGERGRLTTHRSAVAKEIAEIREEQRRLESRRHELEIERRELQHERKSLAERIEEEYQTTLDEVVRRVEGQGSRIKGQEGEATEDEALDPGPSTLDPAERAEQQARVDRLRKRLKSMGSVGVESLSDLDELETRFTRLSTQLADLEHARDELREVVKRINVECKRLFTEAFDTIRGHFRELFRKLFGGGEGDIVLEDPSDPLECGVDIVARPPGKELRNLSLLSGGERTMIAVALLMAIFKSKPSPFCILDEVDAALDEANVERYNAVLREFAESTQFIVITHRKPTMTVCDVLYGVTMQESGVSKRMRVRFEDVNENGEFDATRQAA